MDPFVCLGECTLGLAGNVSVVGVGRKLVSDGERGLTREPPGPGTSSGPARGQPVTGQFGPCEMQLYPTQKSPAVVGQAEGYEPPSSRRCRP